MSNPWLAIALEDYDGRVSSANVRQLAALSDLFKRALDLCTPESVAVVGVAGGNGLQRVDSAVTKKIVGLHINARYLAAVRQRYATQYKRGAPFGVRFECELNSSGKEHPL